MGDTSAPATVRDLRADLKRHLSAGRAVVHARGHDWTPGDAADVVVREYGGLIVGHPDRPDAERLATLAAGADLRRAVNAAREQLGRMADDAPTGTSLHRDLLRVYLLLDVPTVEARLMRPPTAAGARPGSGVALRRAKAAKAAAPPITLPEPTDLPARRPAAADLNLGGNG